MESKDEDFATLFAASTRAKRFERGQTIEGTVEAIGKEVAFVSVGDKGEATIDLAEFKDEHGTLEIKPGDRIQAVVVSTDGGLTLSRRLARSAASARQVEEAFRSGLPVEGKVIGPIKGGYEVRIGHARAFCPVSQIDVVRDTPAEQHQGRVYPFRITEYRDGGRSIVVSRRVLLEAEQRARADEIRESIVPGAVISGRVASVRDFGAFVDFGAGIQGLLHVSEMGWSRVGDPASLVKPGDEITVKVLRVDEQAGKISLGLKQLAEDPWSLVPSTYAVGDVVNGRVMRVAEFGAFVEIAPGIEALAHVSTFPPSGDRKEWMRLVPAGSTGSFEIVSIDADKRRIGITLLAEGAIRDDRGDPAGDSSPDAAARPFGASLADKLRGALERK